MSELKPILQWVVITDSKKDPKTTHQFDKEGNQTNISFMLNLSEEDKLDVLIAIPADQRIGLEQPIGNPFIAVDMRNGLINVNGTNWNFMPHGINPEDVKFRPIWYHTIRKDFAISSMKPLGDKFTLYKIGWQFTHEEKNYQRIIFYDVINGEFSLKEKR
ncbi:hypothetical protein LCGC14_0368550 [marine sediment metagenome]|uniref:Uncharacterized protein n=1 Tax=marine sediment metagenome TaxID=412755 RepID=A0A0F9WEG2_9ZZZZ